MTGSVSRVNRGNTKRRIIRSLAADLHQLSLILCRFSLNFTGLRYDEDLDNRKSPSQPHQLRLI